MGKFDFKLHPRFRLNGLSITSDKITTLTENLLKSDSETDQALGTFFKDWFNDSEFMEMQTSGSTGTPKKLQIKKQSMIQSALATGSFFDLQPGQKVLNCLPVKYVSGKMMVVRSMVLGLDMDYVAPSSNPLENTKTVYEFVAMVPLQVQNSLRELNRIKKLIIGGASVDPALDRQLILLSTQTYATYGMTETVSHIALRKIGERTYNALPNVTFSTDDRNCLVIEAPGIMDEKIITNDLVELISLSEFIFLGRADNIINSGGIKLIPEKIEEKIFPYIKQRFFVIGKPDPKLGEKLILVVEGKKTEFDSDIFKVLDTYEKPKEIIFVEKFKETETGKIIRKDSL